MDNKKYTESNRLAWNEATPLHQKAKAGKFFELFKTPGYSTFDSLITAKLKSVGISGKSVAQLCCNDGREVLSLKNLGASRCLGVDISDEAISEAIRLSRDSGIECEFLRSDIYDIPAEFDSSFDLIYVSIGVFGWLPDLKNFMSIASRLLKPGGNILVYEQHPFLEMFYVPPKDAQHPLEISMPYFNDKPAVENDSLDYYGNTQYQAKTRYWFSHTLSAILTSMITAGIQIISFDEFPHDISSIFPHIEKTGIKIPMCYILQGSKVR